MVIFRPLPGEGFSDAAKRAQQAAALWATQTRRRYVVTHRRDGALSVYQAPQPKSFSR